MKNQERNVNKVIILGSGESILELNKDEVDYINKCKIVIAVNKFMGFYKKTGIYPTHVYFHDMSGLNFYLYILKICKEDNLKNLCFYTNSYFKCLTYKRWFGIISFVHDILIFRLYALLVIVIRLGKTSNNYYAKLLRPVTYIKIHQSWKIIPIKVTNYKTGGDWSSSLKDTIYHFRGSLSSVINIACIEAPNQDIYLVGNDFYGPNYFYQKELEESNLKWKDYTYELVKKNGRHISFQNVDGTKISDQFPFIIENLKKSGNQLYCNNQNSLLVQNAGVQFKPLILSTY